MTHCAAPPFPARRLRAQGFTLIELMITVAIIALLAGIALPAYKEQINKARRADAKTQLLLAQQWIERIYSESYSYSVDASGTSTRTLLSRQPFSRSPRLGEGGLPMYTISLNPSTNTYILTAAVAGRMVGDDCGTLNLDHTNTKTVVIYNQSKYASMDAALAACWN